MSKDAIRVFWRLATDFLWFHDERAKVFLTKTKALFDDFGGTIHPEQITTLNMDGSMYENYTDISLVSMFAAGAMGTDDSAYKNVWKQAVDKYIDLAGIGKESFLAIRTEGDQKIDFNAKLNYYNHCLGILSLIMLSGSFPPINVNYSEQSKNIK